MKYRKYLLSLLIIVVLFIASCSPEEIINEPHVNAFPKKVSYYIVNPLTNTDSLIFVYEFYKSNSGNYMDSMFIFGLPDDGSRIKERQYFDDSTGLFGFKYDSVNWLYFLGLYYNSSGNLEEIVIDPYACDGNEYFFTYNSDGAMATYKRFIVSGRCGGYEDTARFEYKQDTTIVHRGFNYEPLQHDTVFYFTDNEHVSTIPLFYNNKNGSDLYSFISGGYFMGTTSFLNFLPFQTKNMPLIKQVRASMNPFPTGFVIDFTYQFNSNNDVSQLIMNLSPEIEDYPSKVKYKFEY